MTLQAFAPSDGADELAPLAPHSKLGHSDEHTNALAESVEGEAAEAFSEGGRLTIRDMRFIVNAHAYAQSAKLPLTAHATILLDRSRQFSSEPKAWTFWQGRLLDKISRWFIRKDITPAFVWVKEYGPRKGAHLHLLLHLPKLDMRTELAEFIRTTGDFIDDDADGYAVTIEGGAYGMRNQRMQCGALRYVCKSVSADLGPQIGIRPSTDPIPAMGRRYGVSHSIGPISRRNAGWQEMTDLARIKLYLNP